MITQYNYACIPFRIICLFYDLLSTNILVTNNRPMGDEFIETATIMHEIITS